MLKITSLQRLKNRLYVVSYRPPELTGKRMNAGRPHLRNPAYAHRESFPACQKITVGGEKILLADKKIYLVVEFRPLAGAENHIVENECCEREITGRAAAARPGSEPEKSNERPGGESKYSACASHLLSRRLSAAEAAALPARLRALVGGAFGRGSSAR